MSFLILIISCLKGKSRILIFLGYCYFLAKVNNCYCPQRPSKIDSLYLYAKQKKMAMKVYIRKVIYEDYKWIDGEAKSSTELHTVFLLFCLLQCKAFTEPGCLLTPMGLSSTDVYYI